MRKCAFIIPYYGKFGNYFQLFLNSCATNADYDWLIFTDDCTEYEYPANVHVRYESFKDMQERVRHKFDFPVVLNAPYKLCDLKPMYGYLFSEYLQDYEHWGYMLENYDKLFVLGHCSILKNNNENNTRFMLPLNGRELYKEVLQSDRIFTFDESYLPTNVNMIYKEHGFSVFTEDYSANPRARESVFQISRFNDDLTTYCTEKAAKAVYVWRKGVLTRYTRNLGNFVSSELMYMHFQRRDMVVRLPDQAGSATVFKILPGAFEPLEVDEVTEDNFTDIRWKRPRDIARHRWNIFKGDVTFWSKRVLYKVFGKR